MGQSVSQPREKFVGNSGGFIKTKGSLVYFLSFLNLFFHTSVAFGECFHLNYYQNKFVESHNWQLEMKYFQILSEGIFIAAEEQRYEKVLDLDIFLFPGGRRLTLILKDISKIVFTTSITKSWMITTPGRRW